MRLQSEILMSKVPNEKDLLQQMTNGFNYFTNVYQKYSLHYDKVDMVHFDSVKKFVTLFFIEYDGQRNVYDFRRWFIILKDLKVLEREYLDNIGLPSCLYLEFLRMNIVRITKVICNSFEEIISDN